jgi:hypothetical protein
MRRRTTRRTELLPGDRRLLHDLAVLDAVMDRPREPAQEYLERVLGTDFARALRTSLVETAKAA